MRCVAPASCGSGAALGAGAAIDRVLGAGAGAAPRRRPPQQAPAARRAVAFEGAHQAGVLTPRAAARDLRRLRRDRPSRAELADGAARALGARARADARLRRAARRAAGEGPTPDSGVLGPRVTPDGLTVTIGFGASLFDARYGLAARKPRALKPMPTFPDDALVAAETHGDVLVQLCANSEQTLLNALRDLMRATRGVARAALEGRGLPARRQRSPAPARNLLGFKDGTANPDAADGGLMDRLVWARDGEPAWAAGGTYAVVRIIRNRVEFWDRVARSEQELMIGRDKATGAPLGRAKEADDPDYASDPKGERIPLDAHIRLARPRTPATEGGRILRRGYNYSRGIDDAGQLDMGLVFCGFQRDVEKQFEVVQKRLAGEPLVDYVVPTGGGYFFAAAGRARRQDWVGSGLFV